MGKKRLSRDQKRKVKLAERNRRQHKLQPESLAYTGNKFKSAEYVPIVFRTEMGIGEADAVTGRKLLDRHVRTALEEMVRPMRDEALPPFDPEEEIRAVEGQEPALVSQMIRRNWSMYFESNPHPGKEALIGILRTLLSSIETWSTPSPTSRGYLSFLMGFLRKAGAEIELRTADGLVVDEEDEDPLYDLGMEWLEEGSQEAREDYYALAARLIQSGQGARVAEVTQELIGSTDGPITRELSTIAIMAQQGVPPQLPG